MLRRRPRRPEARRSVSRIAERILARGRGASRGRLSRAAADVQQRPLRHFRQGIRGDGAVFKLVLLYFERTKEECTLHRVLAS